MPLRVHAPISWGRWVLYREILISLFSNHQGITSSVFQKEKMRKTQKFKVLPLAWKDMVWTKHVRVCQNQGHPISTQNKRIPHVRTPKQSQDPPMFWKRPHLDPELRYPAACRRGAALRETVSPRSRSLGANAVDHVSHYLESQWLIIMVYF